MRTPTVLSPSSSPVAAGWPCQPRRWCVHEEVRLAAGLLSEACPSPPSPSDDCAEWWQHCLNGHVKQLTPRVVVSTRVWLLRLNSFKNYSSYHSNIKQVWTLPSNTLAISVLYDSNLKGVRKPREPRWKAMTGGTLPYRDQRPHSCWSVTFILFVSVTSNRMF